MSVHTNEPIRIAVIGAGQFGRNHVRIVRQTPGCRLTAVVDPAEDKARESAGADALALSSTEGLREHADAAIVAAPTTVHGEIGCALMEAGLDVLMEKPLAADLATADSLVRTAARTGRLLQAGHLERFNPAIVALEEAATHPLFFEIHRLSLFTPRSLDVDVVLDLMIHDIDIVLSLVGREPEEIRAAGVSILSDKVDIANVRLQFPGGCVANLTASRVSTERVRKLRLFQPREYISLDYSKQHAVRFRVGEERQIARSDLASQSAEPLQRQFEAFLESIRTRNEPKVNGTVARKALEVALAIADRIEVHAGVVRDSLRREFES